MSETKIQESHSGGGKRKKLARFLANVAIFLGLFALYQSGFRHQGWEKMAMYVGPSIVCAVVALLLQRDKQTYIGLMGPAVGVVAFILDKR